MCAGVSVDTKYSHANWAWDLGGVAIPLLSDFPRGAVSLEYELLLDDAGHSDRATVLVDLEGIVRFASSVGPSGKRNIDELFAKAIEINGGRPAPSGAPAPKGALAKDATLYVKKGCRFCGSVLRAVHNLKIGDHVKVRDVELEPAAREDLETIAGPGAKVPVLVQGGKAQQESSAIVQALGELYVLR